MHVTVLVTLIIATNMLKSRQRNHHQHLRLIVLASKLTRRFCVLSSRIAVYLKLRGIITAVLIHALSYEAQW